MTTVADEEEDATVRLLERARAGDHAALDELFERHLKLLERWATGRLPRWARGNVDTSDLLQETMLETFKRLDSFEARGKGALQAYLRQAFINRLRNPATPGDRTPCSRRSWTHAFQMTRLHPLRPPSGARHSSATSTGSTSSIRMNAMRS